MLLQRWSNSAQQLSEDSPSQCSHAKSLARRVHPDLIKKELSQIAAAFFPIKRTFRLPIDNPPDVAVGSTFSVLAADATSIIGTSMRN